MKRTLLFLMIAALMVTTLAGCAAQSRSATAQQPETQQSETPQPDTLQPETQQLETPQTRASLPESEDTIDVIMKSYSCKTFKEGTVPDDVLETILECGQKAPSGMNAQPWHFTVVKNTGIASGLASRNYAEGAVVIIVSGYADENVGVVPAFDCALATQNMYIAAQALGLGAHLYYGGVDDVNNSMRDSLGIPEGYEAQIIMLIGYIDDSVDDISSATGRNPLADNVNYIE